MTIKKIIIAFICEKACIERKKYIDYSIYGLLSTIILLLYSFNYFYIRTDKNSFNTGFE